VSAIRLTVKLCDPRIDKLRMLLPHCGRHEVEARESKTRTPHGVLLQINTLEQPPARHMETL
jgi:hypothetical protein